MATTELIREIEHAEYLASHLSAHFALFDAYYTEEGSVAQVQHDPETLLVSISELYEKVDELYGQIKKANEMAHGKGGE